MGFQLSPYTWPLLAVVAVDLTLAGLSLYRRDEPGAVSLAAMMLAVGGSTAFYVAMLDVTTLSAKLGLMRASYVCMALIPVAWLYFAVQFTGRERWATWKTVAVLAVEPAILTGMMLTPRSWGLVNSAAGLETNAAGLVTLSFTPGIWMGLHFGYHYLVFGIGTLLFTALFLRSRHLYRAQAGAILAGAFIPWAGNALYLTNLFDRVHPFPFLLTLSGIAFTIALYRFRLLDPVPTARKAIVEEMGDGVVVLDEDGRIGDANPAARRLLADGGDALTGETVSRYLDEWDRIAAREDRWHEVAVEAGDERRYLEVEATGFQDHHDRAVGRLVVLRDVTQRKRREKTLARYKTIFESVQDRVYVLDADGRFAMVNEPFAAMLGYDQDELVGEHVSTIVDGDVQAFEDGRRSRFEVTAVTASGDEIPCETELSPITFEAGSDRGPAADQSSTGDVGEGTVGVIRDISRRREAERSLKETSHRLRTLVQASPLAILSVESDGTVDVWNPAAERTFGWGDDDVVGERPPFVPEDDEAFDAVEVSLLDGETVTGVELELRTRGGQTIDASISGAPLFDVNDEVTGAVMVVADVTDRKDRERRLKRQNEKLEQFASMLSHDLRNPLSVAKGFTEIAQENDDPSAFERVERAHDRMGRIIDDLLQLARQGESVSETQLVDLSTVAHAAWEVVDTGSATLTAEDDRTLEADPDRLQEAFENLFRNSVEHGSTNDRPEAGDSVEHGSTGHGVSIRVGTTEDGFYVEDDGPGIPEDERDEVFEHGYTTASDGTGFGLSIVAEIVEAHGWTVAAENGDQFGGARFEVSTSGSAGEQPRNVEAEVNGD